MSTVVAFHAHADDEVILTGGTLARAVADGHRVVIVVATSPVDSAVRARRAAELRASARILGVHRVEFLGYAESSRQSSANRFVHAPVSEVGERLAALLHSERADVLLGYDANGGYGHRDHVRVHAVARHAALLADARLLEATMPRDLVVRLAAVIRALRIPFRYDLTGTYSPAAAITHSFDVRRFAEQKQAALAAHESQVHGSGRLGPVMRILVRLPVPVFGALMGREWFVAVRQP